jgi:hypothetical protein
MVQQNLTQLLTQASTTRLSGQNNLMLGVFFPQFVRKCLDVCAFASPINAFKGDE